MIENFFEIRNLLNAPGDLDDEKKEDGASKQSTNDPTLEEKKSAIDISDEVSWEFRWEQSDSAEIHGPHTSTEMLKVNFH